MKYRIDSNIKFLWMFKIEINFSCIFEIKIKSIFYNVHDQNDHWRKNEIITKLRNVIYWLNQTENVMCYIAECMKCVKHKSAIRTQSFHSINVMHFFQLMRINYIDLLTITINENFHILYVIDYFIRFFFIFACFSVKSKKILRCLKILFFMYEISRAFYNDFETHFDFEMIRIFLKIKKINQNFSFLKSFKNIEMIEIKNQFLKSILKKNHEVKHCFDFRYHAV